MKLNFKRLNLQLTHLWAIARGGGSTTAQTVMVELTGADGTVGWGEAAPIARYRESLDTVEAFLKRVDPRGLSFKDVEGSMVYLDTLSPHDMSAKCALNIALLDGAAKLANKPIYDYLGLGFRENHHVSSFTIGIDKPDVIRKKVQEAAPYPVLKMKVGVADDKINVKALREIAPTKTVRVDANEGWKTKEHALEMIEWLAQDGHIEFIEQPMPSATPVKDWVWLKERSPLPIMGDESYHTIKDLAQARECFHAVNVKLANRPASAALRGPLRRAQSRPQDHAGLHDRKQHPDQRRRAPGRVVRLSRPGRQHPHQQRPLRGRHGGKGNHVIRQSPGEIRLAGERAVTPPAARR